MGWLLCKKEKHDGDDGDNDKSGFERDGVEFEGAGASKESKVNGDANLGDSNYSFGEAEALSDEMEEESQYVAEILRIKDVLLNPEDEVCCDFTVLCFLLVCVAIYLNVLMRVFGRMGF